MSEIIIGISAFYHDSAACVIKDGEIIAAAQEERFTRKKHDSNFPSHALEYVLSALDTDPSQVSYVAFYDKPLLKFERLLETYHGFAPRGLQSFFQAIPVWLREKLLIRSNIRNELKKHGLHKLPILFPEHHLSHAASAFFPSPFEEAAILTVDGVGEWTTTTIGHGKGNNISILKEIHFPHSLGLLYSAFTYYCGFRVNSGEYKLMGLAPYGQAGAEETEVFKEKTLRELIDIRPDGSFVLNMKYFDYATGLRMTNNKRWEKLFGIPPRKPESEIGQSYCNMALAIQQITEDIMLRLATTVRELTGSKNLVLAGGVALNSVANGKIERSGIFDRIWIQPAAGDAGGALGAALATSHIYLKRQRSFGANGSDSMAGAFLGPEFGEHDILRALSKYKATYRRIDDFEKIASRTAQYLNEGKIVGWFQGRMEFGPRALGNRSILGDARNKKMQKRLNLQIKFRESFRPFAPAVLSEKTHELFDTPAHSPYMLIVCPVEKSRQIPVPEGFNKLPLLEKLYFERSDVPAITHIDYSARIQTVHKDTNPRFHRLIEKFDELTGYPVIINTSFNVRGEPIVCNPENAFVCFMRTDMDVLVMGNYILLKEDQKDVMALPKFDFLDSLD
jgi:carbamoyltransferase